MKVRGVVRLGVALAVLAGMTAGCGDEKPSGSGGPTGLTKVTYLTSFNTFGRDAYAYVAQEKGFFREAGFDVTIRPGSGTVDVLKLVSSGQADFGVGDFTTTAITIAKEKLPVTVVGMIHQRSLAAIMSLKGRGITQPKDLEGKSIGDQPGSTNQVMFPVYAKAAGFDATKVRFVPSPPPQLPQLLASGRVDAIGQFIVGKGLVEKAAGGKKAVVLPFADVLPDLYGNALVTTTGTATDRPDVVKRFTTALVKGLEYATSHADETGTILRKHQPAQDPKVAAGEVTAMAPAVGTGTAIGSVDRKRVEGVIDILVRSGAVPNNLRPEDVVNFGLAPKA